MRSKPVLPTRVTAYDWEVLYEGLTLASLIEAAAKHGARPEDCYIELEHGSYGDSDSWHLKIPYPEKDERFQQRMVAYDRELVKYNEWFDKNRVNIKKHEIKLREEAEEKAKRAKIAEIVRNTAEIKRLKKQLAKLEGAK